MSKRFKSYEDVEDSLGAFNKDNNLVEFTQLNLLYDMNIEEILGYLNQIKFQGIEHFLSNPENVKQIIISLRKLICRNLNKNNEQLLNYGCDVMMIDIIQYYSENKLNNLTETDYEILVIIDKLSKIIFLINNFSMKFSGRLAILYVYRKVQFLRLF